MSRRMTSGVTPKGQYFVKIAGAAGSIIKTTPNPINFLKYIIGSPEQDAQDYLARIDSQPEPEPANRCEVCGEPIYKGVRVDRQFHYCDRHYKNYDWVQHLLDLDPDLTLGNFYHMTVEHYTDNGFTSTLLP